MSASARNGLVIHEATVVRNESLNKEVTELKKKLSDAGKSVLYRDRVINKIRGSRGVDPREHRIVTEELQVMKLDLKHRQELVNELQRLIDKLRRENDELRQEAEATKILTANTCDKASAHIQKLNDEIFLLRNANRLLRNTNNSIFDGAEDGDSVPTYRTLKEKYDKAMRRVDKVVQRVDVLTDALRQSPSEICSKFRIQGCQHCERIDCCDNINPLKDSLVDAAKKVDTLRVRLANCEYFAEQIFGTNDSETGRLKNNIIVEAKLGTDVGQATDFKIGRYNGGNPKEFK